MSPETLLVVLSCTNMMDSVLQKITLQLINRTMKAFIPRATCASLQHNTMFLFFSIKR